VLNTSQWPPGQFGIRGSSEPTSGLFAIQSSAKPIHGSSGRSGFYFKSSKVPTYEGKRIFDDVTAFHFALERHIQNAAQAIGWVGTTGWGEQAVLQLNADVAVWPMHRFPMSTPI